LTIGKIVVFAPTTACFCKTMIITLVFWEKRQFFHRKLAKMAGKCDHNIKPGIQRTQETWTSFVWKEKADKIELGSQVQELWLPPQWRNWSLQL
jgi:hypothetical protein